jgi:nicotinamidase-related amidase
MSDWTLVGRPGLLIIHMQNAIVKTPSPLETMGHGRAAYAEGVVSNIERLVAAFRQKGLPVVYTVAYTPPEVKWPAYGGFWRGSQQIQVNQLGTWDVEIIEELTPRPEEPIFYNWPFNVFEGTGLQDHLQRNGVETIVLVGVATGMSVGVAAWAAAERFYNLIVPRDATTDGDSRIHQAVMDLILPAIALVTTTEEVIERL